MCILYYIDIEYVIAKHDPDIYHIPYCSNYFCHNTKLESYNLIIKNAKQIDIWLSPIDFYRYIAINDIDLEYFSKNAYMLKKKLKII